MYFPSAKLFFAKLLVFANRENTPKHFTTFLIKEQERKPQF